MKKNIKQFLIPTVLFLIPYLLIYRAFFTGNTLSWGDAPFFYPEALKELFNLPFIWDIRDFNLGGNQSLTLWLFLPTFLFGLFNQILNFSSPILIRLIFYFPATILSFLGAYFLINKFLKNTQGSFLGALLYSFNTYFLMIIDGGQVGVALAYGLFPLVVLLLDNYLEKPNLKNFLLSLTSLFLISNIDLRILMLSLLLNILIFIYKSFYQKENLKVIFWFILILVCNLSLNLFWIIPFITTNSLSEIGSNNVIGFISLIETFYLFQPHFPLNEFGRLFPVPIYFVLLPFLIFGGFLLSKDKKNKLFIFWGLIFLLFVFLAKGNSPPFGDYYNFLIQHLPLAASFRDSTKFLIPALLSAGILGGFTYGVLLKKVSQRKGWIIFFGFYIYILLLIYPALFNQLTGVLNPVEKKQDYQNIYNFLKNDNQFFRTVWFKEKPPLAYFSWSHPSLSASDLYKERPFATQISGSYDLFNFFHSENLKDWFDLLGIKYAFFPEDFRQKLNSFKQKKERSISLNFIAGLPIFDKPLQLDTTFPGYEVKDPTPHIFAQKKAFLIIGGEEIYNNLFADKYFNLSSNGFIFLEEGKVNLSQLKNLDSQDADLVFINSKTKEDLAMVFLQDKMIYSQNNTKSNWGYFSSGDYLKWKDLFLQKGVKTFEFDFGKGVAYSNLANEKINFGLVSNSEKPQILALRYTNSSESAGLRVKVGDYQKDIKNTNFEQFKWEFLEIPSSNSVKINVEVTNLGGLGVLNALALIDKSDLERAFQDGINLTKQLDQVSLDKVATTSSYIRVNSEIINPTQYKVNLPKDASWLVFTDHFDKGWQIGENPALPFYAMVNGFYIPQNLRGQQVTLTYRPQKLIPLGIYLSLASFIIISSGVLIFLLRKKLTKD